MFIHFHLLVEDDVIEVVLQLLVGVVNAQLLKRVGLDPRINHFPGQLSGGERQRVAVVRALINSPKLLLADEPTGALDQASSRELGQLLVDLNREEQVSLVVVTHALELAQRMSRQMELRDGQLTKP